MPIETATGESVVMKMKYDVRNLCKSCFVAVKELRLIFFSLLIILLTAFTGCRALLNDPTFSSFRSVNLPKDPTSLSRQEALAMFKVFACETGNVLTKSSREIEILDDSKFSFIERGRKILNIRPGSAYSATTISYLDNQILSRGVIRFDDVEKIEISIYAYNHESYTVVLRAGKDSIVIKTNAVEWQHFEPQYNTMFFENKRETQRLYGVKDALFVLCRNAKWVVVDKCTYI